MEKRSRWIVSINTGAANSQRYYTSPRKSAITSPDKGGKYDRQNYRGREVLRRHRPGDFTGERKRKSVDLSNVNGILKVSHFQKSKYWILIMLTSFAMKGLPCQATWQNLSKELPLSPESVRCCLFRMASGYTRPNIPRYHRPYCRRLPSGEFRILRKGRQFIIRYEKLHPELTNEWTMELIEFRLAMQKIRDKVEQGKANYLLKQGVKP